MTSCHAGWHASKPYLGDPRHIATNIIGSKSPNLALHGCVLTADLLRSLARGIACRTSNLLTVVAYRIRIGGSYWGG